MHKQVEIGSTCDDFPKVYSQQNLSAYLKAHYCYNFKDAPWKVNTVLFLRL